VWHITIEVAGPADEAGAPDDFLAALNDLLRVLEPYDPVLITPAPEPVAGMVRYGADLTFDAESLSSACDLARSTFRDAVAEVRLPRWRVVHLDARTDDVINAELAAPSFPALLGVAELAERLTVSKARASELARSATFPRPLVTLASGPIWLASSVASYVEGWNRKPGRPIASAP
jgi:hypothetical protein